MRPSPRDATVFDFLAALGTTSPNGLWTLSVTDMESGGLARLDSWGMTMTAVPEPPEYAGFAAAGLVAFGIFRRLRRR